MRSNLSPQWHRKAPPRRHPRLQPIPAHPSASGRQQRRHLLRELETTAGGALLVPHLPPRRAHERGQRRVRRAHLSAGGVVGAQLPGAGARGDLGHGGGVRVLRGRRGRPQPQPHHLGGRGRRQRAPHPAGGRAGAGPLRGGGPGRRELLRGLPGLPRGRLHPRDNLQQPGRARAQPHPARLPRRDRARGVHRDGGGRGASGRARGEQVPFCDRGAGRVRELERQRWGHVLGVPQDGVERVHADAQVHAGGGDGLSQRLVRGVVHARRGRGVRSVRHVYVQGRAPDVLRGGACGGPGVTHGQEVVGGRSRAGGGRARGGAPHLHPRGAGPVRQRRGCGWRNPKP
mmetsp:Transcript_18043/g.58388  ORF Transcript_18043/g.58388 Transcript_18043/m.58388 type:complete len:344 (+) Transcript_18043:167-1198(+)